jgi:hypothetical protein
MTVNTDALYLVSMNAVEKSNVESIVACIEGRDNIKDFYDKWAAGNRFIQKLANGMKMGIDPNIYTAFVARHVSVTDILAVESNLGEYDIVQGFESTWREYADDSEQHTEFNGKA